MKKTYVIGFAATLVLSVCTIALAAFQPEPKVMPYRGEEWHLDIEKKEYPHITVIPKDRPESKVYGNGYIGKAEPEQKEYKIIPLGK